MNKQLVDKIAILVADVSRFEFDDINCFDIDVSNEGVQYGLSSDGLKEVIAAQDKYIKLAKKIIKLVNTDSTSKIDATLTESAKRVLFGEPT